MIISGTFDGEVLRLDEPVNLDINQRYLIRVQPLHPSAEKSPDQQTVLQRLEAIGSLPGSLSDSTGIGSDREVRRQQIQTYLDRKHGRS